MNLFRTFTKSLAKKKNSPVRRARLGIERLEERRVMSAAINSFGDLVIAGASSDDNVIVSAPSSTTIRVSENGVATTFSRTAITGRIKYDGNGGNDFFQNVTALAVTAHGGTGNDSIFSGSGDDRLFGDSGNDYLYGQGGNDALFGGSGADFMDAGDGRDNLVSIDNDTSDTLFGGSGTDSFWMDENYFAWADAVNDASSFEAANNVHRIGSFANGADRTLDGDNLADPVDGANYKNFANRPLFASTGPSESDVVQGNIGDCWLMSSMGAVAHASQNAIRQDVTDLGDGTYAVRLGGTYYRVDADLPTTGPGSTALNFARPGQEGSIWTAIVEKAYTWYHKGAISYASLDGGPPSAALAGLNASWVGHQTFGSYASGQAVLDDIATKLSAGKAMTVGFSVVNGDCPCHSDHAYTVVGVNRNAAGQVTSVILRNPWGYDGAGRDDNTQDGLVTVTAKQLFSCAGTVSWGDVA